MIVSETVCLPGRVEAFLAPVLAAGFGLLPSQPPKSKSRNTHTPFIYK